MPQSIPVSFANQFNDNVRELYQQKGSRLRGTVMQESQDGELEFFDRVGAVAAVEKTGRHSDTPILDVPHSRRAVISRDFVWATLLDKFDRLRLIIDPTSNYVRMAAHALGRVADDLIIAAALGDALAGKTGDQTVPLPAGQVIPVGGANLTVDKLRDTQELFDQNEVDEEDRFFAFTAAGRKSLLAQTEITSSDFNTDKALVDGQINTFMGFNFIRTERLPKVGNIHSSVAWQRNAITFSVAQDIMTRIDERPDKNYSIQVYSDASFNAVRMEEEGVIRVDYDVTL